MEAPHSADRSHARILSFRKRPDAAGSAAGHRGRDEEAQVYLTLEGRMLLAAHLEELRSLRIPALIAALRDRDRDGRIDAEYVRAVREASRIHELISSAGDVRDMPRTTNVVSLGDRVSVLLDSGERQEFMVVDPAEAPVDMVRISSDSPLSQALLGRRLGAEVTVRAPAGQYRCVIVGIRRDNHRRRPAR